MKKQIYILLLIIFFGFYLFSQGTVDDIEMDLKVIPVGVCIENNCFNLEIADTFQKREIGLMNRKNMSNNNGMLFIFEKEGVYNFWMKKTLISLDIIWIDENYKIIHIQKNAQPCTIKQCETFGPNQKAKYVLEINGGLSKEMGFEVGDKVKFR
ncbi:MAG: DUF192 domain-containing protein [Candidatus Pacebacteria bacterium]|nr:DUF192 domain-containing protein [Candidatus Paceibacterota bacterium]